MVFGLSYTDPSLNTSSSPKKKLKWNIVGSGFVHVKVSQPFETSELPTTQTLLSIYVLAQIKPLLATGTQGYVVAHKWNSVKVTPGLFATKVEASMNFCV